MTIKILPLMVSDKSPPFPVATKPPSRKIKIGQVQLNTSFDNQYYFPLASGMLQAYAIEHFSFSKSLEFSEMIYKCPKTRKEIDEIGERLSNCDILACSNYVWGEQHTLELARVFKRYNPNGIVIFGGPQVPDSKKQFRRVRTAELTEEEQQRERANFTPDYHQLNPFIDICVHGEGERVFRYILEQMAIDGLWDKSTIPSISYTDRNGDFHYNKKLERMTDEELSKTASPFTTGIFDQLIALYPDQTWIVMYETDRGCPFTCTFCDWGGATEDRLSLFPMEQVHADIMWMGQRHIPYIFVCNANFGIKERDIQIAKFFAEAKSKHDYPEKINTQNSKNPKRHTIEALKVLQKAGLNKAAILSQQSLNPSTLKAIRRDNMNMSDYLEMQNLAAKEDIDTMSDLILSLPEETYESMVSGVATLVKNGQHNRIQTNNLSILRNTEMGDPEYQERYGFKIVKSGIINLHGGKSSGTGIQEFQEFVVSTSTMPKPMWLKARAFCWAADLFYFNKLLQIPIIILHKEYGFDYGEAIRLLCDNFDDYGKFPVLSELKEVFVNAAQNMYDGGEEFIYSSEWLGIYWAPGEYGFIKLCKEEKIEAFYQEVECLFYQFMLQKSVTIDLNLLRESIILNKSLLKLPFQTENIELNLTYNIWDIYKAVRVGEKMPLIKGNYKHIVDRTSQTWDSWEEWQKKVVWWENRRGAYLYGNKNPSPDLEGHH